MNLRNVILSYPAIRYRVAVSHFTSRHSTAFEWLILEAIRKVQEHPDMADVPVATIFEELFLISDAERLIKPCILSLYDGGAIVADNIDDNTPLSQVPMRNLRLTDEGARLQRDGLLPGKTETTFVEMFYDPVAGTLLNDAKAASYSTDSATGTWILPPNYSEDDFSPENVAFPASLVMEELRKAQAEKRWNWITPGTQIQNAEYQAASLLWKNVSRSFQVREGWECFLDGDGGGVASKVLDAMSFPLSDQYADALDMTAYRPDKDMQRTLDLISLNGQLAERMKKDALFVVNSAYFLEKAPERTTRKEKSLRAAIVDGAEKLDVSLSENQLTVFLPEHILPTGAVYENASEIVRVGKVNLSAPLVRKEAVLCFVSDAGEEHRFFPLIDERIVEKYSADYPDLLFLLPAIGQSSRFAQTVKDFARRLDSPQLRYERLLYFDRGFERIYGGKLLNPKEYGEILVDREEIVKRCASIADMERVLSESYQAPVIREREDYFQSVVGAAMEAECKPDGIEELWHLWACLRSLRKSVFQWVIRNRLYSRFYTPDVRESLARKASFSGETEIENYTPIEDAFLTLERTIHRILEKMPEVSLPNGCSSEQILACVLEHREEINDLHSEVRNWEDAVEDFALRVGPLSEITQAAPQFVSAIRLMDGLKEALSNFFDDRAIKFQRVYVADTCALMDRPELIDTFVDGKALLILPVLVLEELDAKKGDIDDESAWKARKAIRQIERYQGNEWLDNTQNSCPNLLSVDLNPDRNDNKILSIAIKYAYKNAVLITDDRNLRNLASSQRIKSMDSDGYMNEKAHETESGSAKKNRKKKR